MAVARGSRIEREFLTPVELREVFHALVEAVGHEAAFAQLALIDGSKAIVRFPKLSDEFIEIESTRPLQAADFAFLPDRGSEVWGGDRQPLRTLLRGDLRRYWWVILVVTSLATVTYLTDEAAELVATVGQLLVVASSLFFTVFVIFGIGQVIRPTTAHILYRSGTLQESLDGDRYCVRLSIAGFGLALLAVAWNVAGRGVVVGYDEAWSRILVDLPCLVLLGLAATGVLLSLLATVGYLLDRSAQLALAQTALQAFEAASDRRQDVEASRSASADSPRR